MATVPRIFVDSSSLNQGRVRIVGADAAHLSRSLRVRPGETIVIVEAGRTEHGVVLDTVRGDEVTGAVVWSRDATGEPRLRTHVLQSLPQRGMDDSVEALSQLGVTEVHPVLTARTVSHPDEAGAQRKLEHWRAVAREAAQLAGRARTPVVHGLTSLPDACAQLPPGTQLIAATPNDARSLAAIDFDTARPVAIAIGPEGGFEAGELAWLAGRGASMGHLGTRVLAARTAGAVALALVLARAGELDTSPVPPPKI